MPLARPSKFAHIVYRTRRFKEMIEWYKTVFGANVQFQNPVLAFLTYDDEHHRLALADMAAIQPDGSESDQQDAIGVDHVGYTLGSIGELLENYSQLRDQGITPYWCVHHGVTISMYYADPDGNQMEFQVDLFDSFEKSSEFMRIGFATNPVGVEYDPDQLLESYRAGTPQTEMLSFYNGGEVSPIRGSIEKYIGA